MIGILPTLMPEHLTGHWMSESMRYQALNDSIFTARGEDILIVIAVSSNSGRAHPHS
jgi:hypothetical protein